MLLSCRHVVWLSLLDHSCFGAVCLTVKPPQASSARATGASLSCSGGGLGALHMRLCAHIGSSPGRFPSIPPLEAICKHALQAKCLICSVLAAAHRGSAVHHVFPFPKARSFQGGDSCCIVGYQLWQAFFCTAKSQQESNYRSRCDL